MEYLLRKNKNTAHHKPNQRKPKEKEERNLTLYSTTSVQFSSSVMFNSCEPMKGSRQTSLSITNLESTHIHVPWVGNAIQPCHPLSSPSPPAFNFSQRQGLFKWVSSLHQVAKYWSFSFSISPSSEHSGLISFRMDWLHLLEVQGTLKILLQHQRSKIQF